MKLAKWSLAALCVVALAITAVASAKDKPENKYPNATRPDPKISMSSGDERDLNKANDLVNENKTAEAQPILEKVLANDKTSKYAQAFAHYLMAQVYWDQDNGAKTIAEYQQSVALDALPNDTQFQVIFALAQTQIQEEKYQDALATLADWEKLSGSQNANELALKANAYYRTDQFQPAVDTMKKALATTDSPSDSWMQILMASYFELNQYDEAAALVEQQLTKDPNNKKLLNQLATIYIQGDKPQKALDVLAKAKTRGLVTSDDDYVQLAKLYSAADNPKEAAATMQEGFSKGALKPTFDNYKLMGDVCTQAEIDACAIEGYTKAAPMAKDGNVEYQLGYLLFYSNHSADALVVLDKAIAKGGLRQEGEAYLLRGDAKNDLDQEAAAMADWQKAAGYPSTKTMADQRIKAAKGGSRIKRSNKK